MTATNPDTVAAPYDKGDVGTLAEVISKARMSGIYAGSSTLARVILDAGYRRLPPGGETEPSDAPAGSSDG